MAMNKDFGAFELKEKIGSGGMASVYLAVQKSLQRPVVLKILYPHLAEDEKLVQRFEREARAAAMMRHENIIQVIDCGRHEDVAYICMEFVEGMDLQKWLKANGTPPIEMALLMLRDMCRGLEHAHVNRIIHRDIKPANVMLTPDGTIKIMDFGLARSGGETSTQMTMVGSVMGTPAYMSPEQATGEVVDERSDIFSAGVLAYELLGGQRPFSGDSYSTVLRSILTVEPPELSHFNPLVPDDVAQIVRGMLQKDVSRRYATIAQVRQELEGVIEQMGLHRGKDLLREYALDPQTVGDRWRHKRQARHMDQGLYFENMGLGKIDDALLEFRRVLYLDPDNADAKEHVKKLERERENLVTSRPPAVPPMAPAPANSGDDDMRTMMMMPGQANAPGPQAGDDQTMMLAPGQAPPPLRPIVEASTPSGARVDAPRPAPAPRPAAAAPAQKPAAPAPARKGGLPVPAIVGGLALVAAIVIGAVMFSGGRKQGAAEPPAGNPPAEAVVPAPATSPAAGVAEGGVKPPAPLAVVPPPKAAADSARVAKAARAAALAHAAAPTTNPSPPPLVAAPGKGAKSSRADAPGATPPAPASTPVEETPYGPATVIVNVTPFAATFSVDGEQRGANQKTFRVSLKSGKHTLRAVHPALGPKEWTVDLAPGETRELSYDFLAAAAGTISVTVSDGWAEVYLDGDKTPNAAPCILQAVPPGSHEISLVREGFTVEGGAKTVVVKAGQQASVSFKLKRKK